MKFSIQQVSPDNISLMGIYCLKNQKDSGFTAKRDWYLDGFNKGLRIKIATDSNGKQLGFIEYVPSEFAWRPIAASNYLFIHCIFIYPNKNKGQGIASTLVQDCIDSSINERKNGVATFASKGSWMTGNSIFTKMGFQVIDSLGRFDLMVLKHAAAHPDPEFINWEKKQKKYQGWHLVYANQCPYHEKSAMVLAEVARQKNIDLKITEIKTAKQAQNSPTGFGVFGLIYNGKVLQDHYISKRRFMNIIESELKK